MATKVTEVRLAFRRPPRLGFLGGLHHGEPNQVVLRIDPDPGLRIGLTSKGSGQRRGRPCISTCCSPRSSGRRWIPTSGC